MNKLQIYTHESAFAHDTGAGHPESIARIQSVMDALDGAPLNELPRIQAREATTAELTRAHPISYIQRLQDSLPFDEDYAFIDGDTVLCAETLEAATHGAGAVCQAVDDIATGNTQRGFCAMRPPGHHAMPEQAMGFCFYGNIFIGARHAQEAHNITKIAIIDFDVHHGNGTDFMARKTDNIFYISSHQAPLFPGTGDPADNIDGKILNINFDAGTSSETFRSTYKDTVFPALHAFKPNLIMISAGFDAHKNDPIGGMKLTDGDFNWVTTKLAKIANQYCDGRIVSVLEGGYNLTALKSCVAAHVKALMNE
jgi:acetoin utilization deacetylase AcuC-like enzyme